MRGSVSCSTDLCAYFLPVSFQLCYNHFTLCFEVLMPTALFSLFSITFSIQGLLWAHTNFSIFLFYFWEGLHSFFLYTETVDCFGQYRHEPLTTNMDRFSILCMCVLFSFFCQYFLTLRIETPHFCDWIRSKVISAATVSGAVFLTSFLEILLQTHLKSYCVCVSVYLPVLRSSFISPKRQGFFLCVDFKHFPSYKILSSENKDNLDSSFPLWMRFICPVLLAWLKLPILQRGTVVQPHFPVL